MKYSQGRSFPPTAQGVGLIFILVGAVLFYFSRYNFCFLLLSYPTFWLTFSTTNLDTKEIDKGFIRRQFGFFPFIFSRKIDLNKYDAGIIKLERVKYKTTQSTGIIVISSQETPDEFMALSLKTKGKYETEVLFKGTREEIVNFIKANLLNTHLRFFNGVLKKEYEILFKEETAYDENFNLPSSTS